MESLFSSKYAAAPRDFASDSSAPATEAGQLDNRSVFSDSTVFDPAEKNAQSFGGDVWSALLSDSDESVRAPCASLAVKPRRLPFLKKAKRWAPILLQVSADDPEDEFDIGSAQYPIYDEETDEPPKHSFANGEPDMRGEIRSCFEEPGLLYRVIDRKSKTWAFYNDSFAFEVHVSCIFGKHSKIEALENTTLIRNADGCFIAEVVVYSGETEMFIKGFVNGVTSRLRAVPLSDAYLKERCALQERSVINEETAHARSAAGEHNANPTDTEKTLSACIAANIPFVDPAFPPLQSSMARGARKNAMRTFPWFRPRMYLRRDLIRHVRLFRRAVVPGCVQRGELGDCWLMCAVAALCESAEELMRIFRHPRGAAAARKERAVGAFRVTMNQNGMWRSVVVDDFFPVVAGRPRFARSADPCEMWPAVLEKVYAKMYGSYAMIRWGDPLHALTDLTGCPTSRFDDAFACAQVNGGQTLFREFVEFHEAGYQMILITGGKAPAFVLGTNAYAGLFQDNPELEALLSGTGLVPGHAYTVLDVRQFREDDKEIQLLKFRNPWGFCAEWNGPWSPSSAKWDRHLAIAEACAPARGDNTNDNTVWMSWEHVLKYFKGGGIHFRHTAADYRVPLTFMDCRPSLVVEVSVDRPTWFCFILTNVSSRGLWSEEEEGEEEEEKETNSESSFSEDYPPLMMSLSTSHEDMENVHKVIRNTSADITKPSPDRWTFLQTKEISMVWKLVPEESPYLLVPRMMETEDTVTGSTAWFTKLHDKVQPLHFVNRNKSKVDAVDAGSAEIPAVLGIRCSKINEEEGVKHVQISFKRLEDSNAVFENFPRFPADTEELENVYFQEKLPKSGFAEEKFGTSIF